MTTDRFLCVDEVAQRLRCSMRSVHEITRLNEIPHRKLPGRRRCLFLPDELQVWENGAQLEVVDLARGGASSDRSPAS
jgi:excisionase family DNA binding protein